MKISRFKIHIVTVIYLSLSIFSNAQTNYKDGYVVLSGGDTIKGQINYKNWETNPRKISFKDSSSAIAIYTPNDLQSFAITGLDIYKSAIVDKDIRPLTIQGLLAVGDKEISAADTAFLRLITSGNVVTLYELWEDKVHYYIQENEGKPEELIYKKYLVNNNTALIEKPHFRNQLTRLSLKINNNSLADKIENTGYNEKELRTVIRIINGENSKTVKASESRKKNPIHIMAGAGVEFYSAYQNEYENHIAPIANVAVDLFRARNKQKVGLRLQISYLPLKYETTGTSSSNSKVTIDFAQHNLIPEIDLFFVALNRKALNLYGGFGFGLNLTLQSKYSYYHTNPPAGVANNSTYKSGLETVLHPTFFVGAKIINKINLGLATKISSGDDNSSFNGKFFPLSFTASYIIFSRKPMVK